MGAEPEVLDGRSENRSRAVYFMNSEKKHEDCEHENKSEEYCDPDLVIKRTNTYLHIMQTGWEDGFFGSSELRLPEKDGGKLMYSDFGWTTEYKFPTRGEVDKKLKELGLSREKADDGTTDPSMQSRTLI